MARVLVIGLGASGAACTKFLAKRGWEVVATDTREAPPALQSLQTLEGFSFVLLSEAQRLVETFDLVVISPGISPFYSEVTPLIQKAEQFGIEWVGEIELFARELQALKIEKNYDPVVLAITATNGKTTTTVLTGKMAEAAGKTVTLAGNIGPNAVTELDRAIQADALPDVWVLELSSFQLQSTKTLVPTAAALLNITQDHLDWHGSFEDYLDAKGRIFANPSTVRILNRDDGAVMRFAEGARRVMTFGADTPVGADAWGLTQRDNLMWLSFNRDDSVTLTKRKTLEGYVEEFLMPEDALKIKGRHNAMNALAALALIHSAGLPLAGPLRALANYGGEAHRVQYALTVNGVDYIDDSKGTNVGATVAALEGLGASGRKIVIILGGDGKGQDFSPIAASLERHARGVVLIGRDAPMIAEILSTAPYPVKHAATLPEAVRMCADMALKTDYVLLSPACASWDMFKDYAERSEIFIESAKALLSQ